MRPDAKQRRGYRRVMLVSGLLLVAAGVGSAHRVLEGWGELSDEAPGQFAWDKVDAHCPRCGSADWLPIAYGLPTNEGFQAAECGEVWLGGCGAMAEDRYCKACQLEWESLEHQFKRSRGALPRPRQ